MASLWVAENPRCGKVKQSRLRPIPLAGFQVITEVGKSISPPHCATVWRFRSVQQFQPLSCRIIAIASTVLLVACRSENVSGRKTHPRVPGANPNALKLVFLRLHGNGPSATGHTTLSSSPTELWAIESKTPRLRISQFWEHRSDGCHNRMYWHRSPRAVCVGEEAPQNTRSH
jgi:hypothetical protein